MNISVNWIRDFVDLPQGLSDKDIAERITLSVCEIEGFERSGEMLSRVSVAEVKAVSSHPDADKLKLATVALGNGKADVTVVCGAPNCRAGIKVPYAALGTRFPDGFILEPKKIRGVLSEGMLCSEKELGLSENHEGLMELPGDAAVGKRLSDALADSDNDLVLDVDNKSLTHRPDLWGHYGMAREFAAVFETPFIDKFDEAWADSLRKKITESGGRAPVVLDVNPDSANLGFMALTVDGIEVAESPEWMQRRLLSAGMRPINSIVDISNYVMLEIGIPNHIFNRTTLAGGRIVVRRAGETQEFITLDEHVRHLIPSDTLVCDAEKPSAIAGIMGGLDSSVADDTNSITIEVANWTDAEIRRTSTRLGLRTDASQRYEKCLDSQQLEKTLLRIYELMLELNPNAKAVGGIQQANMTTPNPLSIDTSPQRLGHVLGEEIDESKMTAILTALGFGIEAIPGAKPGKDEKAKTHRVHVPSRRATKDIDCEADIVEEIGRIIGYDNIEPVSPVHEIEALRLSPANTMMRKAQDYLVLRGRALEVMTYPLVGEALLDKAAWPIRNENLVLANALTSEHDRMRPSIIPSFLEAVSLNSKEHSDFRIFETGRSYQELDKKDFSRDLHQIAVAFQSSSSNPFGAMLNTMEGLLSFLGLPGRLLPGNPTVEHPLVPAGWLGSHPHEFVDIQVMGRSRGVVLSLHPQVTRTFKIKGKTTLAVLDLTEVKDLPVKDKTSFRPLDRFPGSHFDLTVLAPEKTHVADIIAVVRALKVPFIRSVGLRDLFILDSEHKAVTLRIDFRDEEKTLEAAVIKDAEERIMASLDRAGYPLKTA